MAAPNPTTTETIAPKLVKMQLTRNYVPRGPFTIVGYDRPEIKAKDAAGREHIVQTAAFIDGEMAPPIHPGVGFVGKVWASTVIEVPEDEARDMRRLKIAEAVI